MIRRLLLRALLGAAALGAALALGLRRWRARRVAPRRPPDPARRMAEALRAHFSYLDLDDAVLAAFARDHLGNPRRRWDGSGEVPQRVAIRFLLSTDFFPNGADEGRPLRYVAYYHPYRTPCYNPLVRRA